MRRAIMWLVVFVAFAGSATCSSATEASDETRVTFNDANTLYKEGDYEEAIERYQQLVDNGVVDKNLYYNLANAYYKADDLGRAVLYYERTLRMAPRENDARENLDLVRTQLKDKQFVKQQNRVLAALVVLHNRLTTREMFLLASLSYIVLCMIAIAFVLRESPRLRSFYNRVSIVSPGRLLGLNFSHDLILAMVVAAIVLFTTGFSTFRKIEKELRRSEAVVLAEEVPVLSSPTDDATLQFRIHEGTLVLIRDERGGWFRIQLPGGLSGWVARGAVDRV